MAKIVDRTLEVFEIFARERQPLSISDLARVLQIPVSSCHDLVRALQSRGYLYEIGARAGYYPTLRLRDIGAEIAEGDPIVARAAVLLSSLRDELDESVFLSKAHGHQATYLLAFAGTRLLRVMRNVGDVVGALHANRREKRCYHVSPRAPFTRFWIRRRWRRSMNGPFRSKTELIAEIEQGRRRGWFINNGESEEDILSISAPFRWNATIYIVTIAAPTNRFAARVEEAGAMLTDVVRRLEKRDSGS